MNEERLDRLDAEQLDELRDSPGWRLVEERLKAAFAQKVTELRQVREPVDMARAQGFLDGIERALYLPKSMADEARQESEHGKTQESRRTRTVSEYGGGGISNARG